VISRTERYLNVAILTVLAAIVLVPSIGFVLAAVSPSSSGAIDLTDIRWDNFVVAWEKGEFGRALVASFSITIMAVVVQTILAVMTGYAFGMLRVTGERILFPLVVLGLMISSEVIVIPLYYTFRDLHLTNSWIGLAILQIGMGVPFGAFWMRAAFRSLPGEIAEAAEVDGAGTWRTLWTVLVPMVMPAIITLSLLSFMWTWNDYFLSLIFISDPDLQPATLALGSFQGKNSLEVNLMAAGSLIVAAPVLLLYVFFQRHFIKGVVAGSLR
jgi:raffinose/stachyose/melibiose transport system permease protein